MNAPTPEAAAYALFESGALAEAERAWRAIVEAKPDDPEALHLLGYILAQLGRADEGLAFVDRSIERSPGVAGMHSNRAVVLKLLGREDEAMRDLQRALQLDPRTVAARNMIGNILRSRGRAADAEDAYRRALADDPRSCDALVGLALIHLDRGEIESARARLDAALRIDPGHAAAHYNLGVLLQRTEDLAGAETSFRAALSREAGNFMALNNLGVVLRRAGREAEAAACLERAVAIAPNHPDVLNNVGISHQRAARLEQAMDAFGRAAAARPGFALALTNWGNALQDAGDLEQARQKYTESLAASPGFAEARYGQAQVALCQHRFAEGWRDYEARFETLPPAATPLALRQPRLTASNLGRASRVAVWMEQGVGDQVAYSTLLVELERRGMGAVVEVDPRLEVAYRRRFPAWEFTTLATNARAFDDCDFEIPLGSLGGLFRPTVESFAAQPRALLAADPARVEAVRQRLGPGHWIGISWRSFQAAERAAVAEGKSVALESFAALARAGARLLDLQYGDTAAERDAFAASHPGVLTRLAGFDAFNDLETLLAALAACDEVVSVNNATAHLAGAIGAKTRVVTPRGWRPQHYWMPAEGRCLWYPCVGVVSDVTEAPPPGR